MLELTHIMLEMEITAVGFSPVVEPKGCRKDCSYADCIFETLLWGNLNQNKRKSFFSGAVYTFVKLTNLTVLLGNLNPNDRRTFSVLLLIL